MNQTNYLKIFSIALFLIFGGISCWATAESLHMLLASWPKIFCYLVAIGFFVVASIGTKLIVDSLNQKIYVEGRTAKLFGGIVLVLIFWLFVSMPTNTHTFIYRNIVQQRVSNDISTTKSYLSDIRENKNEKKRIEKLLSDRLELVQGIHNRLIAEIEQPNNPGNGPMTDKILAELTNINPSYQIHPMVFQGKTVPQMNKAKAYYADQFARLQKRIENEFRSKTNMPTDTLLVVNGLLNLDILKNSIENGDIDLNSAEDMDQIVTQKINEGYQAVNLNKDFVTFHSEEDQERYTTTPIVTETKRLTSIFDVWADFMSGKLRGSGFVFWICISILVDIAAFIFFDIAFKKRED